MDNKKLIKYFSGFSLVVAIVAALAAIFYNRAFVPSTLLMTSLYLFTVCYYIKDDKKKLMYILFAIGVIFIIISLVYTYLRLGII